MLGDLAGLPLLMNAPCSHCEQISTRGSDAAVASGAAADHSGFIATPKPARFYQAAQ
jgi:hypothetical protein